MWTQFPVLTKRTKVLSVKREMGCKKLSQSKLHSNRIGSVSVLIPHFFLMIQPAMRTVVFECDSAIPILTPYR